MARRLSPPASKATRRTVAHAPGAAGRTAGRVARKSVDAPLARHLAEICAALRRRTGHDFAGYKDGTLLRRIRRRMQALHLRKVAEYLRRLDADEAEPALLLKDLLVSVTEFFRDPQAFQALAEQVLPRLAEGRPSDAPIRIWVAGCASGEEAYSVAMLVREQLSRQEQGRVVQIFGTDLDAERLARARLGRYPAAIAEQVGPARLARFFVRDGRGFRVTKELREMCIFSQHDLVRDPPFSQLDLVSCRNVLIYLAAATQRRLLPLFHHALRPGGFLFLGPSEGLGGSSELFEVLDPRSRILRRRDTLVRPQVDFPLPRLAVGDAPAAPPAAAPASLRSFSQRVGAAFERMALDEYTAPCAVVNEQGEMLLVAGRMTRWLQPPSGAVTTNLLELAPPVLAAEVRDAMQSAAATRRPVVRDALSLRLEDGLHRVRLTVRPIPGLDEGSGLLAVALQDVVPSGDSGPGDGAAVESAQRTIERLESELRATRAELRTSVEQLEAANEELKSSNEELISTNEELQSANEELQTSQEELQSVNDELAEVNGRLLQQAQLLHLSHDAILVRRFDGTIEAWNRGAQHLYGYSAEEAIGRRSHELLDTAFPRALAEIEHELRRTGAWAGELRHRTKDGRRITVLSNMQLAQGEDGVYRLLEANRDFTDRKRAEAELRLSEEKFSRAFHGNTAAMALTRLTDGAFIDVNLRWSEVTGWPRDEAVGRSSASLNIWRRLGERDRFVERLLRDGQVQGEEHLFVRRGGEEWIGLVSAQVTDLAGERAIVSSILDVTEQKRAQEALRESEARFRAVYENATDAIIVTDPDREGRILAANPAACSLFGYTEEEMRGLNRESILDLADPNLARLLEARARLGHATADLLYRRKDGSTFTGELSTALFVDRAGRRRAVATIRDVTPRKAAEAEIRRNEQLLREADRRRTEFLAVLSHELRNPLAPIRNSLYVMEHAAPDGEQGRRARVVIHRQVEQLTRLVDDLLDVTRITRGKVQLQRRPVELNQLVRHTVEDHRSLLEQGGLRCEVATAPEPVLVDADPNRLAQVVGNLLSNAAKFTPHGGRVSLSVAAETGQAVVRVADDGVGMAPDMLGRLFEPFTQADATLDRSKGGLGLGLALVKGLVELHGGSVTGESGGPDRGSTFTVRLPLGAAPTSAEPPAAPARSRPARRVLVIEDNVDAAQSLREVLELNGHQVAVAYDGPEGLARAREFGPDVVLCDIGLPGMDGYAIARAFRADPSMTQVRLVALSGYALPEDLARASAAGFEQHLAKPPSPERLERALAGPDGG